MFSNVATEAFQGSATSKAYGPDQIQVIINMLLLFTYVIKNNQTTSPYCFHVLVCHVCYPNPLVFPVEEEYGNDSKLYLLELDSLS